jgi:hypothetical protein
MEQAKLEGHMNNGKLEKGKNTGKMIRKARYRGEN